MSLVVRKWKRWLWLLAGIGLLIIGLVIWRNCRDGITEVPLGVEHAVVIAYNGPELVIKPYRRGVDVNLRLERTVQKGDVRVYDFRYIINRPVLVDISTFLTAADGLTPPNLPSFQVRGVSRLSKTMERRIREIERMGVRIPHGYYVYMGSAILLWIVCFFLLVFWRPRHPVVVQAAPVSLAMVLRALLERLRAGTLDAAGKARLESIMFHCWQAQWVPAETDMLAVLRQVEVHATGGADYRMLEEWLHNPAANTPDATVVAALTPYSVEPATRKEP